MSSITDILKSHKLRRTESREVILRVFIEREVALSEPEIEQLLSQACDRVTIYRNLSTFLEKGIIHKVLDDTGARRYALCVHECDAGANHNHDHVHFKCVSCGETRCLTQTRIPEIRLPDGYSFQEVNLLVKGICASCRQ